MLRPAGLEASTGAVSSLWHKQPGDPTWDDDAAMKDYLAFMKQWAPAEPADDWSAAYAYSLSQFLVEILKNCGDDLTRENVLKQATNVKDLQLPLFVPGVRMNISPANRLAWRQARMARFDGRKWVFFGDIVHSAGKLTGRSRGIDGHSRRQAFASDGLACLPAFQFILVSKITYYRRHP